MYAKALLPALRRDFRLVFGSASRKRPGQLPRDHNQEPERTMAAELGSGFLARRYDRRITRPQALVYGLDDVSALLQIIA